MHFKTYFLFGRFSVINLGIHLNDSIEISCRTQMLRPRYKQHGTGINSNIFNHLLLPHSIDMKIATELQKYFAKRAAAKEPGLLEEECPSRKSFACRFASRMNDILQDILDNDNKLAEKKNIELLKAQQEIKDTLHLKCSCEINRNGKRKRECRKCSATNIMLKPFVKTLPEEVVLKNASSN